MTKISLLTVELLSYLLTSLIAMYFLHSEQTIVSRDRYRIVPYRASPALNVSETFASTFILGCIVFLCAAFGVINDDDDDDCTESTAPSSCTLLATCNSKPQGFVVLAKTLYFTERKYN